MGGRGGRGNQNNQPTSEDKTEQAREKTDKLLDDGFAALKDYDTATALDDFSGVLQVEPGTAAARIGMGLARAQQGKFPASATEFTTAIANAKKTLDNPPNLVQPPHKQFFANQQPDPDPPKPVDPKAEAEADLRLATFDLAVACARSQEKPRAMVLIDRLLSEKKPTDEMMVNAQRSVIATLDDKALTSIAALPGMLKNLETADAFIRLAHAPLRRWGVTWMDSNDVTRHRTSRETEPLPRKLPFLLPDDAVLPEDKKPDAPLVNPLLPIVMAGSDGQPAPPGESAAGTGSAAPTTAATTAPAAAQ